MLLYSLFIEYDRLYKYITKDVSTGEGLENGTIIYLIIYHLRD